MKFIKLESRGGNYLVVASNVAWLRVAEKGQTNVGIIGGQPLLVVGSIEEVAEKILNGVNGIDSDDAHTPAPAAAPAPVAAPPPAPVAAPPMVAQPAPVEAPEPVAEVVSGITPEPPVHMLEPEPAPKPAIVAPEPAPEPVAPAEHRAPELEPAPAPAPEPAFAPVRLQPRTPAPAHPRPVANPGAPLWERPFAPTATGLKIKAGSQRMMGMLE